MTVKMHMFYQALLTIGQILNLVSGFVPVKYQPFVALAITLVQAALGWYNHNYNPDGTPSSVAYVAKLLLLFLLFSSTAFAQTATKEPAPLFSVSTQAVALRIGGQTVAGTDAIGTYNLTPNLALQSDNILAPANNLQAYLGGLKYTPDFLSKLFVKTNLSSVRPYVHAAIGIARNVPAIGVDKQHYSALAGAGFDYAVNGMLSVGPRVEYFNAPGFGRSPHGAAVSANLTLVLGKK